MKTTTIAIQNDTRVDLFIEKREDGFELWVVASIRDQRVVLGHHLTHDDVEARLHYAKPSDLAWREAQLSEIPTKKHRGAIDDEDTIKEGTFWD
jgi:hypothetical protein